MVKWCRRPKEAFCTCLLRELLMRNREESTTAWFYPRSLFCDLVPNLFGKLFLSSGLQTLRA